MSRARPLVGAALVFGLASVVLVAMVRSNYVAPLDLAVATALRSLGPIPAAAWVVLSAPGAAAVIVPVTVLAAAALWWSHRRVSAACAAVATGGGYALMYAIKAATGRHRPEIDLGPALDPAGLGLAGWDPGSLAFPSGHALLAFIVYGYLANTLPRAWRPVASCLGLLIALLVGASRVGLGAHWPSDVLGGWLIGAAWLSALLGLRIAVESRGLERASTGPPAP